MKPVHRVEKSGVSGSGDSGRSLEVAGSFLVETRVLEMVAKGYHLNETLAKLAGFVLSRLDDGFCVIFKLDSSESSLESIASEGAPADLIPVLSRVPISGRQDPFTRCIRDREVFLVEDFVHDTRVQFDEHIFRSSHPSCWLSPILSHEGHGIGLIAIFGVRPALPNPTQMEVIRSASHIAGIAMDQKEAELAMRDKEMRLRALVNSVGDGIITLDRQGKVTSFNSAAESIFGYPSQEIIQKDCGVLFSRSFKVPVEEEVGEDGLHEECWGRNKNATVFPLDLKVTQMTVGNHLRFILIVRDITDRKQAEDLTIRFGRILDSSFNEIYLFDAQSLRIVQVNQGVLSNLGYDMQEITQMIPLQFQPEFTSEQFNYVLSQLREGKRMVQYQTVNQRKDGSTYPVEVHLQLSQTENPPLFLATVQDITQRKRAEEELQLSRENYRLLYSKLEHILEEERKAIAMRVHDEVGQVLTAIKMELARLKKRLPGESNDALLKAESMDTLIEKAIHTGRQICKQLRPEILDLYGLAEALQSELEQFQRRSEISCEFFGNDGKVPVDTERSLQVYRIFQEALTNVARHSQASHVEITLDWNDDFLELWIADDGIGFDPGITQKPESFGFISMRERTERMGGKILFDGRPGEGCTVRLKIPVNLG